MSKLSDKTFANKQTLHSECSCCEHAAKRINQLERTIVRIIDAHDAPPDVRMRAIEDALMLGRGLTF